MVGDRRGPGADRGLHTLGMVTARLRVSLHEPAGLPDAIELFDEEFIFSRGRTISLARRFSAIFSSSGCFVAAGKIEAELVSALAVRAFTWIDGDREWRGAMIGLVSTKPQYRGRGYAAELLTAAEERCRALGVEFAVLWAANPAIYRRLGWNVSDRGMLGTREMPLRDASFERPVVQEASVPEIHDLHQARVDPRVRRQFQNYGHLPPPAERLRYFREENSFAISGQRGRTGYVYELAACDVDMPRLWEALSENFDGIYVNVESGSDAHRWLRTHTPLEWQAQTLAMWKPLRPDPVPFRRWYIPFMDRI